MSYFDEDNDLTIKVVIVGNGAVGKSSLIQRYCRGIFTNQYKKTIGVDFLEKTIDINTQKIRLMCWDTAGQEEFDALTNAYYRGAHACVIAFSTTDRESFNSVTSWHKKIEYNCGVIPTILVQNKIDLHQNTAVSRDEVNELSAKNKLPLFLTSSKENINIENAFYFLAKSYCDSLNAIESPVLKNKVNYFLSNKINKNQPQIRIPYRPMNDENKYKNNEIIFKPIYKNCWPSNPLIINKNKNFFNEHNSNQAKIVIGRQNCNQLNVSTEPKLIKNYLPVTIPAKLNSNQKIYNCNLIKQPARNLNQANKKFQLQPSIHYLKNSNQSQCIDTYFLIRNQDQIKLHDDLFNKYYPNNDKTKHINDKKKNIFKTNIFTSCKII